MVKQEFVGDRLAGLQLDGLAVDAHGDVIGEGLKFLAGPYIGGKVLAIVLVVTDDNRGPFLELAEIELGAGEGGEWAMPPADIQNNPFIVRCDKAKASLDL